MNNNIFALAEIEAAWAKPISLVRMRLWDKSITLVRTHRRGHLMIPLETVWAMFNLDVQQETARICQYPIAKTGLTWIKSEHIDSPDPTLYLDLDALPYYLSTVPTADMEDPSAKIIVYIAEVARGKLADYFRLGQHNLDRRFEYLQGVEENWLGLKGFGGDQESEAEDDDAIPF